MKFRRAVHLGTRAGWGVGGQQAAGQAGWGAFAGRGRCVERSHRDLPQRGRSQSSKESTWFI